MPDRPQVLLLSSNLRRRYSEDILTALALPPGAVIQFRYGSNYLAPALRDRISQGRIVGAKAALGFIADHTEGATNLPFIMPVRIAEFVSSQSVADMFVLRLRMCGYPDVRHLSTDVVRLREGSKTFYDALYEMNGNHYFPAVTNFPYLNISGDIDGDGSNLAYEDSRRWQTIVERLALHDTFTSTYFMQISNPTVAKGRFVKFDASGQLNLRDGQAAKLNVTLYSDRYLEDTRKSLSCSTDGRFLRVSSDARYDVALRYDSVEFWLQPNAENFDALARVTIRLGDDEVQKPATPVSLTASGDFPVLVRRSRPRLLLRMSVSALGAILVALPAILGQNSSLRIRISSAFLGAILLAYAAVMMSRRDG